MVCVDCEGPVEHDGFRYCMGCIEKDKERKEKEKLEYARRQKEYKVKLEHRDVSVVEEVKPNAITSTAKELQKLNEEHRQKQRKTDDEYKVVIDLWLYNVLLTLDKKLKDSAMRGEKSYTVDILTIINPGTLPNGKRCYRDREFHQYLTGIIDPLSIFKEKVGAGISVTCKTCNGVYCGNEKYPDTPENVSFSYTLSW